MTRKAFTLVELIVVITILAILWTISFISLQWYSREARDSKRITDTRNLLWKINIETTKWTDISRLIKDTTQVTLKILWNDDQWVQTFWVPDFENLKELWDNFKDPSNWNDYPVAYAIWWTWSWAYKFVQVATISEKDNTSRIIWTYYKKEPNDSPSLFLTWALSYTDPGWTIYEDNWSDKIYDENKWWDIWLNINNCPKNPTAEEYFVDFFDTDTWTIWGYSNEWPKNVIIPCEIWWVKVLSIWYSAFWWKNLISVEIPSSVTTIWSNAFAFNNLTSVNIPNSIAIIWSNAFYNNKLIKIEIPSSVMSIWDYAFWQNEIIDAKIHNWVNTIWNYAFFENKIQKIDIPSSVTNIWYYAFSKNELIDVKLHNSEIILWDRVFNDQNNSAWNWVIYGPTNLRDAYYKWQFTTRFDTIRLTQWCEIDGSNCYEYQEYQW